MYEFLSKHFLFRLKFNSHKMNDKGIHVVAPFVDLMAISELKLAFKSSKCYPLHFDF